MDVVKDGTFTSIFWRLSNENNSKRESAVSEVLKYVENVKVNQSIYLNYTIERFVKGLKSIRSFARIGFATALTTLIIHFSKKVDHQELLNIVKKHLYDAPTETKGEGTGLKIGQLFLISSLSKADLFVKFTADDLKWLTAPVQPLLEKGDYRMLAFYTMSTVVAKVSSDVFEEALFPLLESFLTSGWDKTDQHEFLVLVTAAKYHPSVINPKWLKKYWDRKRLFRSASHEAILSLMEKSFEGREHALTTPHPLIAAIVEAMGDDDENLSALWQLAVGKVFADDGNTQDKSIQSKAVLLQLFFEIILISRQADKLQILSPSKEVVLLFHKQLTKVDFSLHSMASQFVQSCLPSWCAQVDQECQSALFSIITSANPTFDNEVASDLRVTHTLIRQVDSDRLMTYAEALCQAYETEDIRLDRRVYITHQLRLLIVSGESLPSKYILSILTYMLDHLCSKEALKQQDPIVSTFYKCLDWLSSAPRRLIKPGQYLRRIMKPLLQHGVDKLTASGLKSKELVITSLKRAHSLIGKKSEENESSDSRVQEMFALLYAHLGLHSLADTRGMEALLKDVDQCFEKAISGEKGPSKGSKKRREEENQPHWTEVITDCLLSLLSQGSRLLRSLVRLVFTRMVDHLTPVSSQLLSDVLVSRVKQREKRSLMENDDDDDLLNFDNDDEEDEEEGEEKDEDEDEEEEEEKKEDSDEEQMDVEKEEEEEDDDEEEEEEEDDEEDNAELAALRERVKSALGSAGPSVEENDDSDMDDEAMFRLDSAIVAAFKATNKATSSKKAMEERRLQLIQLKSRCLDLVEIVLQQSTKPGVILPCLAACIQVIGRPDEGELKIADIIGSIKKRQKPLEAETEDEVESICKNIVDLMQMGNKAQPLPKFLSVLASVILFLLKSLPESSQRELIEDELRKSIEENSPISQNLLTMLFERSPMIGWNAKDALLKWTQQKEIRLYNRTLAVTILIIVLKFTTTIENQGAFRASCLVVADRLLKDADVWSHPHLARQIMELAFSALKGGHVETTVSASLHNTVSARLKTADNNNRTVKRGQRRLLAALGRSSKSNGLENGNKKKRKNRKRKLSETI